MSNPAWPTKTPVIDYLLTLCAKTLAAYRANDILIQEHSNLERSVAQGSYGRRQIYELIQNGADALLDQPGGKIQVIVTAEALYCANEGRPIDKEGVAALLHSHLSVKRRNEIGRFGLGFKSVLGVTRQPQFYSRTGSFAFDEERSAKQIRDILPGARHCPVLRLAYPLDAAAAARLDPILSELMTWATTIVRLDRTPEKSSWLEDDIESFPSEFLLFCPHVGEVVLENRPKGIKRSLAILQEGEELLLSDGQSDRVWRVFRAQHRPSADARKEAGELADREELPLIWAVPTSGRMPNGQFWAFFPLRDETSLSGIVNAPWKTNDDRTGLLAGRFNSEMIDAAAALVIRSLPSLVRKDDPGWILDILPGRLREVRCPADELLNSKTYELAANAETIPDQTGVLRKPTDVQRTVLGVPREVLDVWSSQPTRPTGWAHASIEGRERRPRADRIWELVKRYPQPVSEWLQVLRPDSTPTACIPCIKVAAELMRSKNMEPSTLATIQSEIRRSFILVDDQGKLAQPQPESIFLPTDHAIESNSIKVIHKDLASNKGVVAAISELGIQPVTPELELSAICSQGFSRWVDTDWDRFWGLVRRTNAIQAAEIIAKRNGEGGADQVKVKTLAGPYQHLRFTLIPGPIVPDDGSRDSAVALDVKFHQQELDVLMRIGAVNSPMPHKGLVCGESFRSYRGECISRYYRDLPNHSSRPDLSYLVFEDNHFPGPLEPLERLSEEGKALFTAALLSTDAQPAPWILKHRTSRQYPEKEFESPALWAIVRHGRIMTSLGSRSLKDAASPTLADWEKILPIAQCPQQAAETLKLPTSLTDLSESHWRSAFQACLRLTDAYLPGRFYAEAIKHTDLIPDQIVARVGQQHQACAPKEVIVVFQTNEFKALSAIGKPVVLLEDADVAKRLVDAWNCRPADRAVKTQLAHIPVGESVPLLDQFPALRFHLKDEGDEQLQLTACAEVRRETLTELGKTSEPHDFWMEGKALYWVNTMGIEKLLSVLNDQLDLGLTPQQRQDILQQRATQERRSRILSIRKQTTEARKLLAALGETSIRPRLPANLVQAVERMYGAMTPSRLAELALVVYGVDVLKEFREELEQAGLQPPQRWAGSTQARKFVSDLGFPRSFAGFEEARRDPILMVDGPSRLPELHNFQIQITKNVRKLLVAPEEERRGLISLPTGAGKTRVAVQALVDALRENNLASPILWIAQSDELCEQAVQTWREVWRFIGSETPLQISRLWAQNEAEEIEQDYPHVVVATIQKLVRCIDATDYEWLSRASAVVVDEAHTAIAPEYTRTFAWLGIERKTTRCPLLGLTATPFRGMSETETERLVARFKQRLDPPMNGDPYAYLQRMEVLSQVEHRLLKGMKITLTPTELEELKKLRNVPASVYDRIAVDEDRNQVLVDSIDALPREWPILVFAASVEHAQTMAALLALKNIKAAPISANTEPGARRKYIASFRRGDIQVLTNYGVLTQGFDAPATRAIYVARPTFSPNLYQQMIGRGLRGPRNGGKDKCLIVNVEDNFQQYGERLAFQEFERLWTRNA